MRDFTRYEEPTRKSSPSDEELELFHGYEQDYDEIISERNNPLRDAVDEFDDEFDIDNYVDEENVLFEEGLSDEAQSSSSKYLLKMRRQRNYQKQLADAIHKINKYIVVKNGRRHLVLPKENLATLATRLRINPKLLTVLLKLTKLNRFNEKKLRSIQGEMELENSSCPGRSDTTFHWWGIKIYLNDCQTKTFQDAISGIGAHSALLGLIPHAYAKAASTAVGVVTGVTNSWINYINREGGNGGIVIKLLYPVGGLVTPPFIWHQ